MKPQIVGNVEMLDRRSACRVCGSKSHVCTVANPRSPHLGLCASCGTTAKELLDWYKLNSPGAFELLTQMVRELKDGNKHVRKPLERAG